MSSSLIDYSPIENYGVIGDMRTLALVGDDGSIDFTCWPRFDSPTIFAALLDKNKGGRFAVHAKGVEKGKQLYLPDTNVLITRFQDDDELVELYDLMTIPEDQQRLVRVARCIRGPTRLEMICAPRFDYARMEHRVEQVSANVVRFIPKTGDALYLTSSHPITLSENDAVASTEMKAGDHVTFVMETVAAGEEPIELDGYADICFKETTDYWHAWANKSRYRGRYREIVQRSALVLKLLTSRETGALVAAGTFALPEAPHGERNWDYRYTWIRDAGFAMYALMRLGYTEEAVAFVDWVGKRAKESELEGTMQIMYGLDGVRELEESNLDHLEGYDGARPVRIGNAAYEQLQLDIYGALMDAMYLANKYGRPTSHEEWVGITRTVDWLIQHWREPDEGIWEFRGGRREFLSSRVMCWVAIDRAMRLAVKRSLPGPLVEWGKVRSEIYQDIHENFWDEKGGFFKQHKTSTEIDASSLLMPLMKFISPIDPRWLSHLEVIKKRLAEDALVRRYDVDDVADVDALAGIEGTFNCCSFWYVECLARAKRVDEARLLFEKLLAYGNHLGLFSEQLGPAGEHLGNYPQALTHLALISAAYALDRELGGGEEHEAAHVVT